MKEADQSCVLFLSCSVINIENELEDFRRKDPPVLTIEDMKQTSSALDLLVSKLEKALADLKVSVFCVQPKNCFTNIYVSQ